MAALVQAAESQRAGDRIATVQGDLVVYPVHHATFVLQWAGKAVYVDPVGGAKGLAGLPKPDLVLVTDIHGDHLDAATLEELLSGGGQVRIIAPKAVAEKLPQGPLAQSVTIATEGKKIEIGGIAVEAFPAYNVTAQRQKFHPKGRGVGYLLRLGGKTVYVAGDTEGTPEMCKLTGVDVAFLPMNLPYTMSVEQAARAIREFKPKIVYPYHFRNSDGTMADLEKLQRLVGADSGVEIRVREWYPREGSNRQ
ncbi:MAG: MBL fold metallo-hydrolase [Thermoguttaceae bacterium]|nr:MBL fold metallo-hydrolase [Thermoguttaceae bacterium]